MGIHHATAEELDRLIEAIEADSAKAADQMPTEHDALMVMHRAYKRLEALGFRDAIYCPKDGTVFEVIEPGLTGIHDCVYLGKWPEGSWWVLADHDMWPSRPCLFRLKAASPLQPTDPTPDGRGIALQHDQNPQPNATGGE